MRRLLFVLAVLFVAIIIALLAASDPGYALITRSPWSIEMPLTLFGLLALVAFGVFYLLGRLLVHTLKLPRGVSRWRQRRSGKKARVALAQGLTDLAAADWVKAEAELLSSMNHSEAPLLNFLGAALASQGQKDMSKRDDYLAQAHKASPENNLAIGMTQGLLQHLAGQKEQALATLTELRNQAPEHRHILRLLMETYLELRDWTGLANLLPDLRRHNVLEEKELEELEFKVHRELLTLSLPSGSLDVLRQAWQAMPKRLHQLPELIAIYAAKLIAQKENDEAESLLRSAIGREWNDELVKLYGRAHATHIGKQLETAKSWRTTHPNNPALFLALGCLALENGATQEAIEFLEKSIALQATPATYHALGRAYERKGQPEKATECYRQGLEDL